MNRNLCFLNFQICIKGQTTNLIYSPCSLSFTHSQPQQWASQMALVVKNLPANAGDAGWIPGSGRSPGGSTATHSSVLVWRMPWGGGATVHRGAKNWTQLKRFSMHAHSIVSKTEKKNIKDEWHIWNRSQGNRGPYHFKLPGSISYPIFSPFHK